MKQLALAVLVLALVIAVPISWQPTSTSAAPHSPMHIVAPAWFQVCLLPAFEEIAPRAFL
jgi:hypothetical protein